LNSVSYAQHKVSISFSSKILNEDRGINIYVPYSHIDSLNRFPVIFLLDSEYTFPLIAGNMEFYNYFGMAPECIIVGINQTYINNSQKEQRWADGRYNEITGLPEDQGELFFNFITDELITFIDSSYNTSDFRIILGHSFTANYINYFFTDTDRKFNGFISLSPYPAPGTTQRMRSTIKNLEEPVYYFLSTGSLDLKGHILSIEKLNKSLKKINSDLFNYRFMDIDKANHTNIVSQSIPFALEHVFKDFTGLNRMSPEEYNSKENLVEFIQNRYKTIESVYGLKIKIRKSDYTILSSILMKRKDWSQLIKLGELCIRDYPDKNRGYFMLAYATEKLNDFIKSIEYYKKANSLPD